MEERRRARPQAKERGRREEGERCATAAEEKDTLPGTAQKEKEKGRETTKEREQDFKGAAIIAESLGTQQGSV